MGVLEAVSVGAIRDHEWGGRVYTTAFVKTPVDGPVWVSAGGIEGDERAHPTGATPEQALYAYAAEDYEWWSAELGERLAPPTLGENLTVRGLDMSGAELGERWHVGDVVVEVSMPRLPCAKMGMRMRDRGFMERFGTSGRPGAYLRVVEEGSVSAGDPVEVLEWPGHGVSVADVMRAVYGEHHLAPRLLSAPQLPDDLRRWAQARASERA